jgi:hypothetical protein
MQGGERPSQAAHLIILLFSFLLSLLARGVHCGLMVTTRATACSYFKPLKDVASSVVALSWVENILFQNLISSFFFKTVSHLLCPPAFLLLPIYPIVLRLLYC